MSNSETVDANEKRYTEPEAMRYLGFRNRLTMWRWRKRGGIGYYLVGRQIWYGEHHLRDFLARCERRPKAVKGVA